MSVPLQRPVSRKKTSHGLYSCPILGARTSNTPRKLYIERMFSLQRLAVESKCGLCIVCVFLMRPFFYSSLICETYRPETPWSDAERRHLRENVSLK